MNIRTMALSFTMMACFSGIALAGMTWSQPVNIGSIEVSDVSPSATGPAGVYLTFSAAPFSSALSACSAGGTGQWAAGGSSDNVKNIMTIATSARLSGVAVKVLWNQGGANQCSGGGSAGYPVVAGLTLQ